VRAAARGALCIIYIFVFVIAAVGAESRHVRGYLNSISGVANGSVEFFVREPSIKDINPVFAGWRPDLSGIYFAVYCDAARTAKPSLFAINRFGRQPVLINELEKTFFDQSRRTSDVFPAEFYPKVVWGNSRAGQVTAAYRGALQENPRPFQNSINVRSAVRACLLAILSDRCMSMDWLRALRQVTIQSPTVETASTPVKIASHQV
jgi:hypothetical protein